MDNGSEKWHAEWNCYDGGVLITRARLQMQTTKIQCTDYFTLPQWSKELLSRNCFTNQGVPQQILAACGTGTFLASSA
jgi:hypothetical protein